jgi:uncharacterized membrane protein YfcA
MTMEFMQDPLWLAGLAAAMAATGLASGTLAGLLGVGGGIVIVPVLFNVLLLFGIPEAVQMKLSHSISPLLLKRLFAAFLAVTSVRMIWSLLG